MRNPLTIREKCVIMGLKGNQGKMKPCRVCQKEFEPTRGWQMDCCRECHKAYWSIQNKLRYRERKKNAPVPEPSQTDVGKILGSGMSQPLT